MSQKYKIYGLKEPNTEILRYIGATIGTLEDRLKAHLNNPVSVPMEMWLKNLKEKNIIPEIILLEETEYNGTNEREVFYMKKYQKTILNIDFSIHNILPIKRKRAYKGRGIPKTTSGAIIKGSKSNLYMKIPKRIIEAMKIEKGEYALIEIIDQDTMMVKLIEE